MSTIRVNAIQNTNTTDGGISIDGSGHVSIEGQSLPSAGPLSNRNLIINGAMRVAQRGTSSSSDSYQTVDRFKTLTTAIVCTQSQQTLSSGDPYDEGFRYFYRQNNDTPSTATNSRRVIQTALEAQDIASSGWDYTSASSYITLSFWVRSSVAQTFYGHVRNEDGTAQNYPFSFALSADTWTKVAKQIPGNSNLQFDNNNGVGLEINIAPFYGTNYTDSGVTVDAWAAYASGTRTPDNTQTWANTTNATFDITGVQLEVGEVATPFEHRSYGDELAKCQRYFVKIGANYNGFRGTSSTSLNLYVPTPVEMRSLGSVQNYSSTACRLYNASTITHSSSSMAVNLINGAMVQLNGTGFSGVSDNQVGWIMFTAELEAEL